MEKGTPHYKLAVVHALVRAGKLRATVSAVTGGAAMGFDIDGIVGIVMALTTKDFHRSMTTHVDHRIRQDVYRPTTPVGKVYVKLTVLEDVLVVSFKEL